MKIGVSLTTSFPRSEDARQLARDLVQRVRTAREAGLDSIFTGDHHAMPEHYFQNVPTVSRLLAEAGEMTVGTLFLVPLWHPLLLAEQVGTMAAFAEGPVAIIAAVGYREPEFAALGVSLKNRPSLMEENLAIVAALLRGETVSMKGRYHSLEKVSISPVPATSPEVWIGASAPAALRRAGRLADIWLAHPSISGEELDTQANIYKRAAVEAGRQPRLAIRRDVYVGASEAEAEAVTRGLAGGAGRSFDPEALLIGGPERVAEEVAALARQGYEHLLVRHVVSEQELILASYQRLGRDVLPQVRDLP